MSKLPIYMRRYLKRLAVFLTLYMVFLISGLNWVNGANPPGQIFSVIIAVVTALPILGVFWTIFRLLVEIDDEYQRLLFAKQILLGTAITLSITTIWQFLNVYMVLEITPQWIGVLWLAMFGIAGGLVRLRA